MFFPCANKQYILKSHQKPAKNSTAITHHKDVLVLVVYWLWTNKNLYGRVCCVCVVTLVSSCFMCLGTTSPGLWGMGMNPFKTMFALDTMPSYIEHSILTSARQPDMWRLYLEIFLIFEKTVQTVSTLYPCSFFRYRTSSFEVRLLSGTRLVWKFPWRRPDLLRKNRMGPGSQRLLQVEHDFVAHYCNIVLTKIPRRLWSCMVFFMKLEALLRASVDVQESSFWNPRIHLCRYVGFGSPALAWPAACILEYSCNMKLKGVGLPTPKCWDIFKKKPFLLSFWSL